MTWVHILAMIECEEGEIMRRLSRGEEGLFAKMKEVVNSEHKIHSTVPDSQPISLGSFMAIERFGRMKCVNHILSI